MTDPNQGTAPPPPQSGPPAQNVPNYLVQSILVTLFCCLPLGIVSIVFASQVNGKLQAGDVPGAIEASNKAKTWCWWSFGLGLAVSILYFALTALGVVGGLAESGAY